MRAAARRFGVSLLTVQRWVARAGDQELAGVDWSDRSSAPRHTGHTWPGVEDEILVLRSLLRDEVLGEYGPAAIRRALLERSTSNVQIPSTRTIARILRRRGVLDGVARVRRPAPPRGWYLPELAARRAELDSFDVIEGHHVGGVEIDVFTGVSLHGGLVVAWAGPPLRAPLTLGRIVEHWSQVGRPGYAQFDNDSRFHGTSAYTDVLSPVVRLCLALAVVPVFAPPREHGFQAAIEQFNGQWQTKVWGRRHYTSVEDLVAASAAYVLAHRAHRAVRIEAAPERRPMPAAVPLLEQPPRGLAVFLRRTTEAGRATVLGRPYDVDQHWPNRLVRAELDLDSGRLSFFGLRRREPTDQPLLAVHPYEPIRRHT
jgi:hypothetical protein